VEDVDAKKKKAKKTTGVEDAASRAAVVEDSDSKKKKAKKTTGVEDATSRAAVVEDVDAKKKKETDSEECIFHESTVGSSQYTRESTTCRSMHPCIDNGRLK